MLIMLMLQFLQMKQLLLIMQFLHVSLADEVARADFAYSAESFHHYSFKFTQVISDSFIFYSSVTIFIIYL